MMGKNYHINWFSRRISEASTVCPDGKPVIFSFHLFQVKLNAEGYLSIARSVRDLVGRVMEKCPFFVARCTVPPIFSTNFEGFGKNVAPFFLAFIQHPNGKKNIYNSGGMVMFFFFFWAFFLFFCILPEFPYFL